MKPYWISAHLFYNGQLDLLLNELVYPFLQKNQYLMTSPAPFFFIRYPEEGDHIRLRLNTNFPDLVTRALNNSAATFYTQHTTPGNCLRYINYEPETDRYGNDKSIVWAEEHFFHSSRIILDWIKTKPETASLQMKAIELHMQMLSATGWSLTDMIDLCNYFVKEWLTIFHPKQNAGQIPDNMWLQSFQKALAPQQQKLFPTLHAYWQQLQISPTAYEYLRANLSIMKAYNNTGFSKTKLNSIISSMLHMTHNRIGIKNQEEAYILYCLSTFLSQTNL
ncbi:thiopeptide-type bacteriocin biosynthesis protein [Chitinophaga sp. LS1]|uniref:thiopeptide-type bacteriocin biosynthesis protein n=1 Tax=Chitinophaga sp. LS1 TaxID=3051176 RepID=UPI002AABCDE7|nr:thiopeptide-type bacteriocin biosynthesis protein [Chitinophaga sp. LS1]WPV66365.1 thiopeptide-type bacteriocin biosynthesis protein [Chitinophaga sp. LS1]